MHTKRDMHGGKLHDRRVKKKKPTHLIDTWQLVLYYCQQTQPYIRLTQSHITLNTFISWQTITTMWDESWHSSYTVLSKINVHHLSTMDAKWHPFWKWCKMYIRQRDRVQYLGHLTVVNINNYSFVVHQEYLGINSMWRYCHNHDRI